MKKQNESVSSFTLSSGLRITLQPNSEAKSVSIYLTVRAGPRYEQKENSGLAHFLEHMLFEGTNRFPNAGELADYIESVGGRSGAWTDKEYVTYYVKVLPEYVEKAIDYLSDIIFNSRLDEANIEKEKRIVIEEMKRKIDNPEMESLDLWMEWTWGKNQSLGRSTVGEISTINNLNKEKIATYLKQFYFPSNMELVIVGDFSEEKVKKYFEKYFMFDKKNEHPKLLPVIFFSKKNPIKFIKANTEQTQIICGFVTGINYFNEDRFTLILLAEILGGSASSRLFYQLVYGLGIAYASTTYTWIFNDTGLFITYTAVSSDNTYKAIKQVFKEINKIRIKLISEKEIRSNKEKIKARLYYDMETTESIAYLYSSQLATEGKVMTPQEIINKINSVSAKDLKSVAQKYFNSENLNIIIRGKAKLETRKKIEEELMQI